MINQLIGNTHYAPTLSDLQGMLDSIAELFPDAPSESLIAENQQFLSGLRATCYRQTKKIIEQLGHTNAVALIEKSRLGSKRFEPMIDEMISVAVAIRCGMTEHEYCDSASAHSWMYRFAAPDFPKGNGDA